ARRAGADAHLPPRADAAAGGAAGQRGRLHPDAQHLGDVLDRRRQRRPAPRRPRRSAGRRRPAPHADLAQPGRRALRGLARQAPLGSSLAPPPGGALALVLVSVIVLESVLVLVLVLVIASDQTTP